MSSRRPCFHLFVYGILRRRFRNPYALLLHRSSDFVGLGRVRGRLLRVRRYRGLRLQSDVGQWIPGEVFRFKDQRLLMALDRYEGEDYERVVVEVVCADGRRLSCWIYSVRER
jgi:gamma-glutamylcyclotransferase (GGCT)/AIG2-like uncharacterized protein YtfP